MKIALAADHGGYALQETVKKHLEGRGYETLDLGTNNADVSVDYPSYGEACGRAVVEGKADLGIVVCGTGIGISIAANKVPGVRCGLCTNTFMAEMTKRHNNANVIALGGRVLTDPIALQIVDAWLDAEYEGGRHQKRVDMLAEIK